MLGYALWRALKVQASCAGMCKEEKRKYYAGSKNHYPHEGKGATCAPYTPFQMLL